MPRKKKRRNIRSTSQVSNSATNSTSSAQSDHLEDEKDVIAELISVSDEYSLPQTSQEGINAQSVAPEVREGAPIVAIAKKRVVLVIVGDVKPGD